jgi:hypothetical protein
MNPTALALAKNKLYVAAESCTNLQNAKSFVEAELAWSAFLMAASTVYSKLEQGTKGSGKCQGWYGRKKKERKDDPLLRYLHFARNSDEHGIEFGTYRNVPMVGDFAIPEEFFGQDIPIEIEGIDSITKKPDGERRQGTLAGPNIVLQTVTDSRYGDKCDPPKMHLGKPILKPTVQTIAALGLAYLDTLIAEAERLPSVPSP